MPVSVLYFGLNRKYIECTESHIEREPCDLPRGDFCCCCLKRCGTPMLMLRSVQCSCSVRFCTLYVFYDPRSIRDMQPAPLDSMCHRVSIRYLRTRRHILTCTHAQSAHTRQLFRPSQQPHRPENVHHSCITLRVEDVEENIFGCVCVCVVSLYSFLVSFG